MRRRSEKRTADVSSPAVTARRSGRRRKSPSVSESEKNLDEFTEIAEEAADGKNRASSEEPEAAVEKSTRRGRGRKRTPVGSSPSKRKNQRTESPDTKIEAIPEEENNGGTNIEEKSSIRENIEKDEEKQINTIDEDQDIEDNDQKCETMETPKETEGKDKHEDNIAVRKEMTKENQAEPEQEVNEEQLNEEVKQKEVIGNSRSLSPEATVDEKSAKNSLTDVLDIKEDSQQEQEQQEDNHETIEQKAQQEDDANMKKHWKKKNEQKNLEKDAEKTKNSVGMIADESRDSEYNGDHEKQQHSSTAKSPIRELGEIDSNENSIQMDTNSKEPDLNNSNQAAQKSNANSTVRTQRKRKWLTKKSTDCKTPIMAISTDSLKGLISDVHPVPLSDVMLDSSPEIEEVASEREEGEETPSPRPRKGSQHNSIEKVLMTEKPIIKRTISQDPIVAASVTTTAGVAAATAAGTAATVVKTQRPPSPARQKTSNVLYITNLVRPFTVMQLKSLLARTGKIVEDGFWIDRIKSKCYVQYETEDEAIETRHALHGVRWPVSNPKCLNVDFGKKADMERAIESTKDEAPKLGQDSKDNLIVGSGWSRGERTEEIDRKNIRPVREWDVGKRDNLEREREKNRDVVKKRSRERELSANRENEKIISDRKPRNRERRDRSRERSPSPARKVQKKENEPPLRLLDDLFRKTKATPCIYWLPLTPEQIAEKEAYRQKRIAEHKERVRQRELEREKERERERENRSRVSDRDRDRNERDRDRRNRSNDRRRSRSRDRRRY